MMADKLDINTKAQSLRKELGEDLESAIDIFSLAHTIPQLTLIYYPMGERISGMCIKNQGYPIIGINSAMSLGRQRFSLAHELYHLYFDESDHTLVCSKKIGSGNEVEKTADQFASYLGLVPGQDSSSDNMKYLGITKAGNSHLRTLLVEAAQTYSRGSAAVKSKALKSRQSGNDEQVIAYADKAKVRLSKKFRKLQARGVKYSVATAAIARELACFTWGLMTDHIN